jgi:two-component system response regulator AdeR
MDPIDHILIVDDDREIRQMLADYLQKNGLRTSVAGDGREMRAALETTPVDLIVLDVMMPGDDGLVLCRNLRASKHRAIPVLMLTARDDATDRIVGLEMGADDYVVKPFNPAEVAARVRAVLRRTLNARGQAKPGILRVGRLVIDPETHAVHVEGDGYSHELLLTLTEYKLLHCMALAPSRIFSRSELMHECLPESEALERTVDSHVSKLRRKLDDVGLGNVPASVRGVGYRLAADH